MSIPIDFFFFYYAIMCFHFCVSRIHIRNPYTFPLSKWLPRGFAEGDPHTYWGMLDGQFGIFNHTIRGRTSVWGDACGVFADGDRRHVCCSASDKHQKTLCN